MRRFILVMLIVGLSSRAWPGLKAGDKAPHFSLTDLNGKVWSPERDSKHKLLLVDFWASWCVPCLKEIPTLKQLQAEHAGGAFQVLGVSMERGGRPASEAAAVKYGVDYPVLLGSTATAQAFGLQGFPSAVLIRDGRVLKVLTGERKWRDFDADLGPYLRRP